MPIDSRGLGSGLVDLDGLKSIADGLCPCGGVEVVDLARRTEVHR